MLHEILLALSGHPSPLFTATPAQHHPITSNTHPSDNHNHNDNHDQSSSSTTAGRHSLDLSLLTPPEQSLLSSLSHLAELHSLLRKYSSRISTTHPSPTCRAIASAILHTHLSAFQSHILSVEEAILSSDARYVAADGIVPLSAIQADFMPWSRRLGWLWGVIKVLLGEGIGNNGGVKGKCSAKQALDYLRKERATGFRDIEHICLQLLSTAEKAWSRGLAMWVVYGEIPDSNLGKEDFFIREVTVAVNDGQDGKERGGGGIGEKYFEIKEELLPDFITPDTAASILFIGKSINALKTFSSSSSLSSLSSSSSTMMMTTTSTLPLSSLPSPISATDLTTAISSIRRSLLSQSPLLHLLPLPAILDVLFLVHDYLLLGRGEFAVTLVRFADELLKDRHMKVDQRGLKEKGEDAHAHADDDGEDNVKKGVEMNVRRGEVEQLLARTWAEMYALQGGDDGDTTSATTDIGIGIGLGKGETSEGDENSRLELARRYISFNYSTTTSSKHTSSSKKRKYSHPTTPSPSSSSPSLDHLAPFTTTLLSTPNPLHLSLSLPPSSPLTLLFPASTLHTYAMIHTYLLSLRRTHIHLSNLYRNTYLRRSYPAPAGPAITNRLLGRMNAVRRRERENRRGKWMRGVWGVVRRVDGVMGVLGNYFGGEVIGEGWGCFKGWLCGGDEGGRGKGSRPGTGVSRRTEMSNQRGDGHYEREGEGQRDIGEEEVGIAHDPEAITSAHAIYISSLLHSLFLTDAPFTSSLYTLLTHVERLVSLITRLGEVWYTLDLEEDEGVIDDFSNNNPDSNGEGGLGSRLAREEVEVMFDLKEQRREVEKGIEAVVRRLRQIDDERLGSNLPFPTLSSTGSGGGMGEEGDRYMPHRPAGVDTLLMKLDVGGMYSAKVQGGYEFGASLVD
ncbi:Spc97/Spc98 [Ascosphaera apis ARSEF 7405]|uniref:Spindle pole body component n=1 Tax=Ascosphaera apis ARSEF 7405 TaxID=392613 RepID=A0A167YNP7_9EURO|nr:Spc97/Spc98 [Ascosphaera apis ARSEF 7405]